MVVSSWKVKGKKTKRSHNGKSLSPDPLYKPCLPPQASPQDCSPFSTIGPQIACSVPVRQMVDSKAKRRDGMCETEKLKVQACIHGRQQVHGVGKRRFLPRKSG